MYRHGEREGDQSPHLVQPAAETEVAQHMAHYQQGNYSPGFHTEGMRPVLQQTGKDQRRGTFLAQRTPSWFN